jgi:aerobic-type carbon monoxide dehydrogenase small subunit (CoxS/CutS family)
VLSFWVNGTEVEIEAQPGEMLSDVLRNRLGLTGTKIGCSESCSTASPCSRVRFPHRRRRGGE